MATSTIKGLTHKMMIVNYSNVQLTSGAYTFGYPSGYSMSDKAIVQPTYTSSAIVGWGHTIQLQNSNIVLYVRQGTTIPADGTKISFNIFFIKA